MLRGQASARPSVIWHNADLECPAAGRVTHGTSGPRTLTTAQWIVQTNHLTVDGG